MLDMSSYFDIVQEHGEVQVSCHNQALCGRVEQLWEEGVKFSQGKVNLVDKQNFSNKLDKLMDSIKCQCPIQLCSELGFVKVGKKRCKKSGRIECKCLKHEKIPHLELEFVRN